MLKLSDIAAVAGKGGLFRVVKPSKSGVILESLDDLKTKLVVGANAQVSVLSEISIYTHSAEGATALQEVFQKIHTEFNGDTGLDKKSDPEELTSFLKHVLPDYDESRVYVSDIKKLVTWYNQLSQLNPVPFAAAGEDEDNNKEEAKEA